MLSTCTGDLVLSGCPSRTQLSVRDQSVPKLPKLKSRVSDAILVNTMVLNASAVPYTLRFCSLVASPPSTVYLLSRLISVVYGYRINGWLLALIAILSLPATIFARVLRAKLRYRREAAALGARPVPCLQGKLPGNYDIMQKMLDELVDGYTGKSIDAFKAWRSSCHRRRSVHPVVQFCRTYLQLSHLLAQ